MKIILSTLLTICIGLTSPAFGKDVTTVDAMSEEISDNLDLEAVASVFGESKDLADFEKRLNDPETRISNLDLNEDGEVDYLKVVEASKDSSHLVLIQAIIAKDQYQDVATVEVEKRNDGKEQVQVVGDVYMYGPGYIIEPVYVHPPVIFLFFWGPRYVHYRSPYYWGFYPPFYRPWAPYPHGRYRTNVNVHINIHNSYKYTSIRKSSNFVQLHNRVKRNDFAARHPDRAFNSRNKGVKNRHELTKQRTPAKKNSPVSTGQKVQKDWKPVSKQPATVIKTKRPTDKPNIDQKRKPTAGDRTPSKKRPERRTPERPSRGRDRG